MLLPPDEPPRRGDTPPPMAPHAGRWRLDVAWRGDAYLGWQRQPQGPTIQQSLEDALARILGGERVVVEASGRTDAGVHAAHQVVALTTATPRRPDKLCAGLNAVLPRDIVCLRAAPAPTGFFPRTWTRSKRYRYRILNRGPRCPFRQGQVWHRPLALDAERMHRAAQALAGHHDFSAFRASGCTARHAVRRVVSVAVERRDEEVHIDVQGHGFLRHQIRIFAGTLVEVGRGALAPEAVSDILAGRDREAAGPTAPACGLWLLNVEVGDGPHGGPRRSEDADADT